MVEKNSKKTGNPKGYWQLLKENRDFRLLWIGEIISHMGDWFNLVAVMAMLLKLTGSAEAAGWIIIIRSLPFFFLSPIAGVVADRFNRKTILILSDLSRALVVLGFLLVRNPSDVWIIYTVNILEIFFSAFFTPAKSAVIPLITSQEELISANALSSISWSVMLTVGAALGGAVSALMGHEIAFILNSVSFIFSAAMIMRAKIPASHLKKNIAYQSPTRQFMEGLRYVKDKKDTLAYLLIKTGWGLSAGILLLITILGNKTFAVGGSSDAGIGILYTARGLGAALGPVFARRIGGNSQEGMRKWIGYSFILGGIFFAALGLSQSIWLACLALVISNCGTSILWVFSTTLLQLNTHDEIRGRVFATEWALFTVVMSLSNYLTGFGLDKLEIPPQTMIFIMSGLILLPGAIWIFINYHWDKWVQGT
jgi:MFS family permease